MLNSANCVERARTSGDDSSTSASALIISASLAQIGEFSFMLAGLGVSLDLLPEQGRDLILAGALLSIIANPLLFALLDQRNPLAIADTPGNRQFLTQWVERLLAPVGGTLDADKINLIVKNGVGTWIIANGETLKSTAQIDVNGGLLGLAGGVLPLAGRVDLATGTTLRMETGNTDDLGSRIQLDAGATVTLAVSSDVSFVRNID